MEIVVRPRTVLGRTSARIEDSLVVQAELHRNVDVFNYVEAPFAALILRDELLSRPQALRERHLGQSSFFPRLSKQSNGSQVSVIMIFGHNI